jgi:MFS family permease
MFLAASLSPLGSTMIAVALPSIGSELGVGGGRLTQWLVSSYLIVGIATMSAGGRLGDRIGHKRGLLLGMTIYGLGSIVGFTVATLPALAFARISMAAGGAMTVPATMALLRNMVPVEKRPRAFGYFGSVMGTAAAVGPLLGGELTTYFGWRSVFIANLPVIALSWWLIQRTTRTEAAKTPTPDVSPHDAPAFDILGSVLLGLGLTLLVVAAQLSGSVRLAPAAVGVTLLSGFVFWERRVAQPVLDLALFRERTFTAASMVTGLQNLAMYSLLFQLPIFFEQVRSVEPGTIGRTIIAMMVAMIICSPIGGRVSERAGARATALAGTLTSLLGVFLLSDFQSLQTPSDAILGLILVGAGLGFSQAPSQAAAMSAVQRTDAGMAGGVVSTARYIGGVIGISALGYLLGGDQAGVASHSAAANFYLGALVLATLSTLALPGRDTGFSAEA